MNILITTPIFPPQIGGPATYTSHLVKLLKKDHNITLITFGNQATKIKGVRIINIPLHQHFLGVFFRQSKLALLLLQHISKNQLVYIQGPIVVGFTSTLICKLFSKPTLLKFVGDVVWETARNNHQTSKNLHSFYQSKLTFKYTLLNYIQEFSLKNTSVIVTPSDYLKQFLAKYHHIPSSKIHTIYNAIESSAQKVTKKKHQLIFVGRLVTWKNVDQIIQSVKIARKQHPWRLIIVGEGPELSKLKKLVSKLNAQNYIKFLGTQSKTQTHKYIQQSQKLILYSSYEGLSHTIIEAMQLGATVIASDIQANKEVLNGFGQISTLNQIKSLAKTINQPSTNTHKAQKFAQNTYSWASHIKQLSVLINRHKSSK